MRHLLPEDFRHRFQVSSAGTGAGNGTPPSELARRACLIRGIDISRHLSRPIDQQIIRQADIILAMERRHKELIAEWGGGGKAFLLTGYPPGLGPGGEIEDPIGRDEEAYGVLYETLEREISRIILHLIRNAR